MNTQKNNKHKFPYNWTLKDANFTKDKGSVFSCFACGGGSTMGYKLAGFDVIGCNEIDPRMMQAYIKNHNPKYSFLEDIRTFKERKNLPDELYNLDILDGSPPCSSFSMVGKREKDWGKSKKFNEGQTKQILDDLFFHFIDLADKLKPKIIIAENVKGLLFGKAKRYVREIYKHFDKAGYYAQHWLLNAAKMGVPQKRERVFFIALRKDLAKPFLYKKDLFNIVPKLELNFNEPKILFKDVISGKGKPITKHEKTIWADRIEKDRQLSCTLVRTGRKYGYFSYIYLKEKKICPTITAKSYHQLIHFSNPFYISDNEIIKVCSFPNDYIFGKSKVGYICGMSVPPVMIAQISTQIYEQWHEIF